MMLFNFKLLNIHLLSNFYFHFLFLTNILNLIVYNFIFKLKLTLNLIYFSNYQFFHHCKSLIIIYYYH